MQAQRIDEHNPSVRSSSAIVVVLRSSSAMGGEVSQQRLHRRAEADVDVPGAEQVVKRGGDQRLPRAAVMLVLQFESAGKVTNEDVAACADHEGGGHGGGPGREDELEQGGQGQRVDDGGQGGHGGAMRTAAGS